MSEPVPFDLVEEILARVPVKSLVRFRCVCKRWESMIRDAGFVRKHAVFAPRKLLSSVGLPRSYVYGSGCDGKPELVPDELDLSGGDEGLLDVDVLGHCNGLLCIRLSDRTVAVWNPSLRELRPMLTDTTTRYFHKTGFGYDPSTDDYKIVRLSYFVTACPRVQIFSLKSRPRRIDFPRSLSHLLPLKLENVGLPVGNKIFWRDWRKHNDNENDDMVIISFDLESEEFGGFSGPPREGTLHQSIEEIRGRLCVVDYKMIKRGTGELVVWGADESEVNMSCVKSWYKLFIVTLPGWYFTCDAPVLSTENDSEILLSLDATEESGVKVFVYDIEKNTLRKIETNICFNRSSSDPCQYEETLVSPYPC